jgi:uncharacterized membrane protein YdbT with pleckstrin-like domain
MAYLDDLLGDDERILIKAHRHILFLILHTLPYVLLTVVVWVVAFVIWWKTDWSNIIPLVLVALSLVPLIRAIYRFLIWRTEEYVVTNYRIIQVEGLLNKRTLDSALEKVNDVLMTQTLFGRLFGYGNIDIITGADVGVNHLGGLAQPVAFKKALLEAKTDLSNGDRDVVRRFASDDRDQSADLVAALNELTNLRESGIITSDEYETRARQLLRS